LRLERRVSVFSKPDQLSATADSAAYARTNETLSLTGNVAWQQGGQSGRAGRVVIRRTEREFAADERVAVQLPRGALGLGGLLSAPTNAAGPAAPGDAPLQLTAAHLLVRSNLTVITGGVGLRDATNRLACDQLTIETAGNDQVATATGDVAVCRGAEDQCLRAARAVYTKSLGTAVFTGEPRWKLDPTEGRAREITLRDTGEIHAAGDVAARVTLASRTNSFLNLFPGAGQTNQSAQVLELFARDLTASRARVTLTGDARVHQSPLTGGEPRLRCETLALHFHTNSSQVELMEAQDNVRFEQGTIGVTNGPDAYSRLTAARLTATCNPTNGALVQLVATGGVRADQPGSVAQAGRATFTAATEILELTGQPSLRTPEAFVTGAEKISWNRKTRHVSARGFFEGEAKGELLQQKLEAASRSETP
jgi:lipopolysaccharide export system protein LptA